MQGSAPEFAFSCLETDLRSISDTEVWHSESLPAPKRGAFSICVSSHSRFYKAYREFLAISFVGF